MIYDFKKIEAKWQKKWELENIFAVGDKVKPKFYGLVEFPYPSKVGMHMGHIRSYVGMDIVSRKRRMEGYNVLFPIGFDAFGLPAEKYALNKKIQPQIFTKQNIAHFITQIKELGCSFDWNRVINTSDKRYYKWTQWIFLKMFDYGLVFRDKSMLNYCPSCKSILSNEECSEGKCKRCQGAVIQKSKDVWYLRISKYAEKLLDGLKDVDYSENTKIQQRNWIGRSEGILIKFYIEGSIEKINVYTTTPELLFGVTFIVIAPEHMLIDILKEKIRNISQVRKFQNECIKNSEFERIQKNKHKKGLRLEGIWGINPINREKIPIYIADDVVVGRGSGTVMGIPGHNQEHYEFAKKFDIKIRQVIFGGNVEKEAYTGNGSIINSSFLNGYDRVGARKIMINELEKIGTGETTVQYKMKEWAFNRQRYWGEPIPIINCPHCGFVKVPYEELPVEIPEFDSIQWECDEESPLGRIDSFVNTICPKCGGKAERETDTMPQWAGSSWYYLRYIDPYNEKCIADLEELKYWMPVDWYNGGMEQVTRHMIYARFWNHFLYDIGVVPTSEPFKKRTIRGPILGFDGKKMSKSKGNVIDSTAIMNLYGADTLRTYIMFLGEYDTPLLWNDNSIAGCKRFLDRVVKAADYVIEESNLEIEKLLNKTIKKVSEDIENMKFNTAISALMIFINNVIYLKSIGRNQYLDFIKLLCPFAPHLCEEIWELYGGKGFVSVSSWPMYDESKILKDYVSIGVQVNGKLRATISVPLDGEEALVVNEAMKNAKVATVLEGETIKRIIYKKNKILNFVIKKEDTKV